MNILDKIKVKEEKVDRARAVNLLKNLILDFPYDPKKIDGRDKEYLYHTRFHSREENYLQDTLILKIEQEGFNHKISEFDPDFINKDYSRMIGTIVGTIFSNLNRINFSHREGIYTENDCFQYVKMFLNHLYKLISKYDNFGGWKIVLQNNPNTNLIGNISCFPDFLNYFGNYDYILREKILSTNEYIDYINDLFARYYTNPMVRLDSDGILRYMDATQQSIEKTRMFRLLNERKMNNVIEAFDEIDHELSKGKFGKAMWNGRVTLETFYKTFLRKHKVRFLIQSRINKTYGKKLVEDGTLKPLTDTLIAEISKLFKYPSYCAQPHNMPDAVEKFLDASYIIVSNLTNEFSHGQDESKSKSIKANYDDVMALQGYIILVINTLLMYEK